MLVFVTVHIRATINQNFAQLGIAFERRLLQGAGAVLERVVNYQTSSCTSYCKNKIVTSSRQFMLTSSLSSKAVMSSILPMWGKIREKLNMGK